jgi:hypothetical protein
VLDEVVWPGAAAGPERHEGHWLLAEDRIRASDDRGFEHCGMGVAAAPGCVARDAEDVLKTPE